MLDATGEYLGESIYHYDHGSIKLLFYRTNWIAGDIDLKAHDEYIWVKMLSRLSMNYPAAELRSIKMNFYLINPDAEHRGILLIKNE